MFERWIRATENHFGYFVVSIACIDDETESAKLAGLFALNVKAGNAKLVDFELELGTEVGDFGSERVIAEAEIL